jgi:hypothetical protein
MPFNEKSWESTKISHNCKALQMCLFKEQALKVKTRNYQNNDLGFAQPIWANMC